MSPRLNRSKMMQDHPKPSILTALGVCAGFVGVGVTLLIPANQPRWLGYSLVGFGVFIVLITFAILITPPLIRRLRSKKVLGQLQGIIPAAPANFVPREDLVERLRKLLLNDNGSGNVTITGVRGMGGIGKTVLTSVLVQNEDIRESAPDGIFWLTVGREPNVMSLQNQFFAMLEKPPNVSDVKVGQIQLQNELFGKECLVVLDDVSHLSDIQNLAPIDQGKGRILVTTRDAAMFGRGREELGFPSAEVPVDVLDLQDALKVLSEASETARRKLTKDIGEQIAEECGRLPLALNIVGRTVRSGQYTWEEALDRMKNRDMEQFEDEFAANPQHRKVLTAIDVSIEALGEDSERYLDLAIFKEDQQIPEVALRKMWEYLVLNRSPRAMTNRFVELGLASEIDGELRLHGLQGDYVRIRAGEKGLIERHQLLLNAYGSCIANEWPKGPNDGYYFENLPYHMAGADQKPELRRLLMNFDWLQHKLKATSATAIIIDYDLFPEDNDMALVQGAIRLSSHVISRDQEQLAGQLLGRLASFESEDIKSMLEHI